MGKNYAATILRKYISLNPDFLYSVFQKWVFGSE